MIDIRLLREDPGAVRAALGRRGLDAGRIDALVDGAITADERRREAQTKADALRAEQRQASKGKGPPSSQEREALKRLSDEIKALGRSHDEAAEQMRRALLEIPNLPHESVPEGATDEQNVVVRAWREAREIPGARDHLDIGTALDVLDVERAARTSGARFVYLKREAALLELALVRFAMDALVEHGFVPVVPPVLVRREAMEATGFLPTDEQQIYKVPEDELYLAGTAEVPLAALHQAELLDAAVLPLRYVGFSSCFRREAGSYGRDVRGMFRVHQFDKVEMFSFTLPERSWDEHELLLAREEEIFQALEVPYRVVNVCTGELGASAAKKYDIEAWLPGQGAYREVTSCSNCTDYQARRLGTRYRGGDGKPAPVHTLNGTAVAVGRALIAILENHQQADGGVAVPDALRPYSGFDRIGPR